MLADTCMTVPQIAPNDVASRRLLQRLPRLQLVERQLVRLNSLLRQILPDNRFYANKLAEHPPQLASLDEWSQYPFTVKDELIPTSDMPQHARNLTYSPAHYVRFHRTSGTHGEPLVVLDTAADWQWWIDTWQYVLDAAAIDVTDRIAMAFSFGPFIGFWTANDALVARGALVIPGGGMSTRARLDLILKEQVTVVCCTPSYALHLAAVAAEQHIDIGASAVRCLIVAGEPGGSLPAVRQRIESAWNATVIDHAGATEIGPWGFADSAGRGLRVVETEFIAEFIRVDDQQPAASGQLAELVLTSLGRTGAPVLRYRTGDLVRPTWTTDVENQFVFLEGGVLGRVDDMMIVRGVNVFPSAVEQILREFPTLHEYRLTVRRDGEMDSLCIEIEADSDLATKIRHLLQLRLGLSVDLQRVDTGTLPRFEHKGQRFIDLRK